MPTLKESLLGSPVLDNEGRIVGRIGENQKEPELSPEEKIELGFKQQSEARQVELAAALEGMSDRVGKWKKQKDSINSLSFASRQKANAEMEKIKTEVEVYRDVINDEVRKHLGDPSNGHFRKLVDDHMRELDSIMGIKPASEIVDVGDRITKGFEGEGGQG